MISQLWSLVLVMVMVLSIPLKFVFGAWYLIVLLLNGNGGESCEDR